MTERLLNLEQFRRKKAALLAAEAVAVDDYTQETPAQVVIMKASEQEANCMPRDMPMPDPDFLPPAA